MVAVRLSYSDDPCLRSARTEKVTTPTECFYLITLQKKLWGGDNQFRDVVIAHECAHIELGHVDNVTPTTVTEYVNREIEADIHSILSGKATPEQVMAALRFATTDKEWEVYTDPNTNWGRRLTSLMNLQNCNA